MKLLTEMSDFGHGDAMIVYDGDATHGLTCDEQLEHDAACAHALARAIKEFRAAPLDTSLTFPEEAINWLEWRAGELMREWGFEEKVTP